MREKTPKTQWHKIQIPRHHMSTVWAAYWIQTKPASVCLLASDQYTVVIKKNKNRVLA